MSDISEVVKLIIISALVGGLIGLEREKKKTVLAGARTFMLLAIYGTFSVFIAEKTGTPDIISASFIGVALMAALMGYIKNYTLQDIGMTTVVAFLIAYSLGVFVGMGMIAESLAASVIVSVILVSKYYLKSFTEALTHREIVNALEFGVIAFVLYPIVPDRPIDPFGVLNPKILLLLIIIVSTMGLLGFISLRMFGAERGLPIIGALGSLVNSEAVSSSLAAEAKRDKKMTIPVINGIVFANITMLFRNLIIVAALSIDMFRFMLLPQLSMAFIGVIYLKIRPIKNETTYESGMIPLSSPFAIIPALKFAFYFLTISIFVKYVQSIGTEGVYVATIIGGLLSSAAVIASLVSMNSIGTLDLLTAASACVIASIASMLGKIFIARINGTVEISRKIAVPLMVAALIGETVLIFQGVT